MTLSVYLFAPTLHAEEQRKFTGSTFKGPPISVRSSAPEPAPAELNSYERHVKKSHWTRSIVAGNGKYGRSGNIFDARLAQLWQPYQAIDDGQGGFFVSDCKNHVIRHVDKSGRIRVVAGRESVEGEYGVEGGDATRALLSFPKGLAINPRKPNMVWFCDSGNHAVRVLKFPPGPGCFGREAELCTIIARRVKFTDAPWKEDEIESEDEETGEGGQKGGEQMQTALLQRGGSRKGDWDVLEKHQRVPAGKVKLRFPTSLCFDLRGRLYISDTGNYCIRRVDSTAEGLFVSVIVGVPGRPGIDSEQLHEEARPRRNVQEMEALQKEFEELSDIRYQERYNKKRKGQASPIRIGRPQQITVCPDWVAIVHSQKNAKSPEDQAEEAIRTARGRGEQKNGDNGGSYVLPPEASTTPEILLFAESDTHCIRRVELAPTDQKKNPDAGAIRSFSTLVGMPGEAYHQEALANQTVQLNNGDKQKRARMKESATQRAARKKAALNEALERDKGKLSSRWMRLKTPLGVSADPLGKKIAISERNGEVVRLMEIKHLDPSDAERDILSARVISGDCSRARNYLDKFELFFSETNGSCRFVSWLDVPSPSPGEKIPMGLIKRIQRGTELDEADINRRAAKENAGAAVNLPGSNVAVGSPLAATTRARQAAPSFGMGSEEVQNEMKPDLKPELGILLAHENIVTLVWTRAEDDDSTPT
uniref:SMP-30/Gluconolactonase/LRE-like region domain-containing protein n=1 Tax=Chromera velia CCMP2878 TaxID=1169474 RepID=A0A0G4H6Q0_9ALVE|eukprot:Cvel_24901.t1-p1 / transcript=Cvel_24901.t1 / gene=Cvel_24901 / organism=Chromera_velia_CCMP2878 / gene_product=hypothetical protein / transcript_product=hypothetical protein / location=Cvel_scaffold2752:13856-18926(-) / protein_length=705 / sequence_SO=supercontig / SO=protein_coding / is_pseudo=false